MNASHGDQVAGRIQAAVSAVPGVERVYGAGGLASTVVRAGAAALGVARGPLIAVSIGDAGARVDASIGVDGSRRAAEVLRAVRTAIESVLADAGLVTELITLTVAHVHPREATDALGEQ